MTESPYFLALQSTYERVEVALCSGAAMSPIIHINKKEVTETLVPHIQSLLDRANLHCKDLSFIAVNTGPAPFTTLRVIIATSNGISFASHIPLIGIDGLHILVEQYRKPSYVTIVLLNAFNNEVYYIIDNDAEVLVSGCSKLDHLITTLLPLSNHNLQFIGNGTELYYNVLIHHFPDALFLKDIHFCSLNSLAQTALLKWHSNKSTTTKLLPHYLKSI